MTKTRLACLIILAWLAAASAALGSLAASLHWSFAVAAVALTLGACWAFSTLLKSLFKGGWR